MHAFDLQVEQLRDLEFLLALPMMKAIQHLPKLLVVRPLLKAKILNNLTEIDQNQCLTLIAHPRNGKALPVRLKVEERVFLRYCCFLWHAELGQPHLKRTVNHSDHQAAQAIEVVLSAGPHEVLLV